MAWKGNALVLAAFIPPAGIIWVGEFTLNDIYYAACKGACGDMLGMAEACPELADNILRMRGLLVIAALIIMIAIAAAAKILLDPPIRH